MSDPWERMFSCDKCGEPLAIKVMKGHQNLVTIGKCPKGHKKRLNLSLANLDIWVSSLKPHLFKCVRCDAEVSIKPTFKGPWVKVSLTCPVHGKNDIRIVPSSVYNAMTQETQPQPTQAAQPEPAAQPSPTVSSGPPCQYCGVDTTFIPQYSRYFCYNCQRYAEDKNVMGKVRTTEEPTQPEKPEDLETNLRNLIATFETNLPYSLFEIPTQLDMPDVDSSKIEHLLQDMIAHGEMTGEIDHTTGEITVFDASLITRPSPPVQDTSTPSEEKVCPQCGSNVEYIDTKEAYFCKSCFEYVELTPQVTSTPESSGDVEVVRDFDYVGGQVRFKVAVRNQSNFVVTNIGVELDIPSEFKLVRILPDASLDDLHRGLAKVNKLMPSSSQGIDFYLEPVACGTGVVAGIAKYQDAQGNFNSVPLKKREVAIKCPLIFTPEEANIAMIRNLMTSLNKDFRRWALPTSPPDSFTMLHDLISQFEINHIQAFQISGDPYQVESWYYTRAKTTNHPIALTINVSELTNAIDLKIACEDMAELTGLLAKISEDFRNKITSKLDVDLKPAFGSLKELLCDCGSPISKLPSITEEVICNSCQKMYTWKALG